MNKKLSIIIPVFNEEKTLEMLLSKVFKVPLDEYKKEIIVVDDGSTDNTANILKNYRKKFNLIILKHSKNRGKGWAIKTGLIKVTGEAVVIQDADLEYDPQDMEKLIKVFKKYKTTVYGSRNLNPKRRGYLHFVYGVWALTVVTNLLYKTKLTDIYTGYKLFPSNILRKLNFQSNGFEFEAEITAKILKNKLEIKETSIGYQPRKFSEGKKIKIIDGIKGLLILIKERFT